MKQVCREVDSFDCPVGCIAISSDFEVGQSITYKGALGQITRIRGTFEVATETIESGLEIEITPYGSKPFWVQESHLERLYSHPVKEKARLTREF